MKITDFQTFDLLNEANVYNIKLPINGVSIDLFLKQHFANISDPTIKQQLTKKITMLLVNDESNLRPLTKLPQDAPEWAQTAAAAGDLMLFVPSEELNDAISNIGHYVQTAINDLQSADNNVVVKAKGELGAIPKMPDLDTLLQKANQYFVKKVKKEAAANAEGMEEVAEYNGWIWYKLNTPDAFRREGNVLQNCIGKVWTQEKTAREGMTIYILRTHSNDSVVAVRAHGKLIQEIKGKNNQPPVERYMPYVFNFVKDSDLDLSTPSAKNELKRAGYWVFNDKIIVPLDKATEMFFDEKTQKLRRIEPDDTIDVLDQTFQVYTNQFAAKHMTEMMTGYARGAHKLYKGKITDITIVIPINEQDEILSPMSAQHNLYNPEIKAAIAKYLVALGKQENLKLGRQLQKDYGLSSNPPYTPITEMATCVGQVAGFDKIDTTKLSGYDNWLGSILFFKGCKGPKSIGYIREDEYEKRTKKGINFNRTNTMYRSYTSLGTVEFVLFVDSNNEIFNMNVPYKPTANQLRQVRQLITAEHLTVTKNASSSPKLVTIPPSTIMTKEEYNSQRISGKNVTNTKKVIEFEDGASFKLLEGNELTSWLEQATANTTTDAVYVLTINDRPVIAIPVSKKKITGMFATDTRPNAWRDRDLEERGLTAQPTTKTLDFNYGPYIKAFAKKMGFTVESKHLLLKPESKIEQMLTFVVKNPGQIRSKALKAAHVGSQSAPGLDAPYNMLDRPLTQLGLITRSPGTRRGTIVLNPTEKGKEVVKKLRDGESVPMFDLITKQAQIRGGAEPEPEPEPAPIQRPEPVQRAERVPGGARPNYAVVGQHREGSKAQQIYDLFVQQTQDNDGTMPARGAFIRLIMQPPFNMTAAGAGTYYYNVKTKYLQRQGQLGETFTFKEWLIAIM